MMKKTIALILTLIMALSLCAFAEDTATEAVTAIAEAASDLPKVVLEASEPDENGYFTVDMTVYNATYKGIISAIGYDSEAITPVDYETKEATDDALRAITLPTVAKNLETDEDILDWQKFDGSKVKDGELDILTILNNKAVYPNSIVSKKFQALADENGLTVAQLHFKKLTDAPIVLSLVDSKMVYGGMMLINSTGMQSCTVEFKYPDGVGESTAATVETTSSTKVSDDSETDAETEEKRVKGRTNGTVILEINNYATVSDSILKWIDKDNKAVKPYIKDNRTMVPLRFIAEELKCKVEYKEDTREVIIENADTELVFQIDSLTYTNDGLKKTLDAAPEIVENRTFVPLRVISEALNRSVTWIEADRVVIITPVEYPWAADNEIEKELYSRARSLMSPMLRDFAY